MKFLNLVTGEMVTLQDAIKASCNGADIKRTIGHILFDMFRIIRKPSWTMRNSTDGHYKGETKMKLTVCDIPTMRPFRILNYTDKKEIYRFNPDEEDLPFDIAFYYVVSIYVANNELIMEVTRP